MAAEFRKPFSPQTLAQRWDCSAEKIRRMYRDGILPGFQLGKLVRIPAAAVERFECQTTESSSIAESSPSPSTTSEAAFASRLARMTGGSPNLALVKSGDSEPQPQASE